MSEDIQVESFAAWMLAAQLIAATLPAPISTAATFLAQIGGPVHTDIVMVDHRPTQVSQAAEAWHYEGDTHVYIATYTDTYKAAMRGDHAAIVKLASIIAHEQVHVMGGDESAAYAKQLSTLRALQAPSNVIDGVQRAMKTVVSR